MLYVRELICVALLLTASDGIADEPVHTSDFPYPSTAYCRLARAVARLGQPVRFAQLLEYQCELELVGEFLAAQDNMSCGGMNVSFSDVYTRNASAGDHAP
jgi:hypothetical protein